MKVSIIIPVFNRQDLIQGCLESALNQNFKEDYEVLVVDDASLDKTRDILARIDHPNLKVIYNERNFGASYSRNQAIKQSRGEYVLFLDSDASAHPNWIEEIIKPFELNPAIMIVSGKTLAPFQGTFLQQIAEYHCFIAFKDGYVHEAFSGNMAVRGSFIKENLFNEILRFSEDFELALRCRRQGFRLYYAHNAHVIHYSLSKFMMMLRSCFRWGIGGALVKLQWREFPFINCGTYILLSALLGNPITIFSLSLFLLLVSYIWFRNSSHNFFKLLIFYPLGVIFALANCAGNIWGIILFCQLKLKAKQYGISVLMYHRINDHLKANDWVVSTEEFRKQMLFLKEHYEVVSMKQVFDFYQRGGGLPLSPKPRIAITLDDGYKDNYVNAFPILREFDLPATIFLVADMIGTDQKMQGYENQPSPDMLNWQEVREMRLQGITFCSHTNTHPHLNQLSLDQQRTHIQDGINTLYNKLGDKIIKEVFCYPYGEYDGNTLKVLNESHVKLAFTVNPGINEGQESPLMLKRCVPMRVFK